MDTGCIPPTVNFFQYTSDQVGDKIVDTAMSRVLYLTDIFEHIIDRFDQGSLSQ